MNRKTLTGLLLAAGLTIPACGDNGITGNNGTTNGNGNNVTNEYHVDGTTLHITQYGEASLASVKAIKDEAGKYQLEGTFKGNVTDLDLRLKGAAITTSFDSAEWISPSVNFNPLYNEYLIDSVRQLMPYLQGYLFTDPMFDPSILGGISLDSGDLQSILMAYLMGMPGGNLLLERLMGGSFPNLNDDYLRDIFGRSDSQDGTDLMDIDDVLDARDTFQLLSNLDIDSYQTLLRTVLAYNASMFNGFDIDDGQALLTDHTTTGLLWVANNQGYFDGDDDNLVTSVILDVISSLSANDGFTHIGSLIEPISDNPSYISAGTTYAFNLGSNYSCDPFMRMSSLYDLIEDLRVVGILTYDLNSVVDAIAPNDTNDECLADTRKTLQKWLDSELGKGVARIPEGGVSSSILDIFNKTTVIIEMEKGLALRDEVLALEDINNDFAKNMAEYFGKDLAKNPIPVKTLNLPAALLTDIDGRPNRSFSFKLSNILAGSEVMGTLLANLDINEADLIPTIYEINPYELDNSDLQDDELLEAERTITLNFRTLGSLTQESCQKVAYILQKEGHNISCVSRGYVRSGEEEYRYLEFLTNDEVKLPINVKLPAGTITNSYGISNLTDISLKITDVTAPTITLEYNLSNNGNKVRTGFVAGDKINLNFSEPVEAEKIEAALKNILKDDDIALSGRNSVGSLYTDRVYLEIKNPNIGNEYVVGTIKAEDVVDKSTAAEKAGDGNTDTSKVGGAGAIKMAKDFELKISYQDVLNKYIITDNVITRVRSSNSLGDVLTEADTLSFLTAPDYYLTFRSTIDNALKAPKGVEVTGDCTIGDAFSMKNYGTTVKDANGQLFTKVTLDISRNCQVYLISEDGLQFTIGSTSYNGINIPERTITLPASEFNADVSTAEVIMSDRDYAFDATYRYFGQNPCGDNTLGANDQIVVDFGHDGYFIEKMNFNGNTIGSAIINALNKETKELNNLKCGYYGTEKGVSYRCTIEEGQAKITKPVTVTLDNPGVMAKVRKDNTKSGKITITLPVADEFTMEAYTKGDSDHDGLLVYGDQLVVESSCLSDSVVGALAVLLPEKVGKGLKLSSYDYDHYDHINRVAFEYDGNSDLDISKAKTVEIPAIFDNLGNKYPKVTLTVQEEVKDELATFTYVAGSAVGNTALFATTDEVAIGSWAIDGTSALVVDDDLGQIVFAEGQQTYQHDNFFTARQTVINLIGQVINLVSRL